MKKTILAVAELSPQKKKAIMVIVFILGLLQNFNSNMFGVAGTAIVSQLGGVEYYTLQFTIFTLSAELRSLCSETWAIYTDAASGWALARPSLPWARSSSLLPPRC